MGALTSFNKYKIYKKFFIAVILQVLLLSQLLQLNYTCSLFLYCALAQINGVKIMIQIEILGTETYTGTENSSLVNNQYLSVI